MGQCRGGVYHVGVGWGGSCRGGSCRGEVGHAGMAWVMKGWDGVGHVRIGWGGSCRHNLVIFGGIWVIFRSPRVTYYTGYMIGLM